MTAASMQIFIIMQNYANDRSTGENAGNSNRRFCRVDKSGGFDDAFSYKLNTFFLWAVQNCLRSLLLVFALSYFYYRKVYNNSTE